jgi:hypothetical protein
MRMIKVEANVDCSNLKSLLRPIDEETEDYEKYQEYSESKCVRGYCFTLGVPLVLYELECRPC